MTCADGFSLFTHSTSTCTLICRVLWHNPHHHCHKIFSSKQAAPPRRPATTDLACLAASADPPCLFRAGHLSPTVGAAPGSMERDQIEAKANGGENVPENLHLIFLVLKRHHRIHQHPRVGPGVTAQSRATPLSASVLAHSLLLPSWHRDTTAKLALQLNWPARTSKSSVPGQTHRPVGARLPARGAPFCRCARACCACCACRACRTRIRRWRRVPLSTVQRGGAGRGSPPAARTGGVSRRGRAASTARHTPPNTWRHCRERGTPAPSTAPGPTCNETSGDAIAIRPFPPMGDACRTIKGMYIRKCDFDFQQPIVALNSRFRLSTADFGFQQPISAFTVR